MSGSAVRAGRAFIEVFLKDQVSADLRGLATRMRAMSGVFARVGGVAFGAGSAMLAAFLRPLSAASDLQEIMSKFDTVFGANAEAVKGWSDGFAKEVGRSKQQIAEFMAGSQDLFVPLGFDEASATNLSKTITGLSIDLASFNNGTDSDALRDLHAALTGSGEVMKKYGVIVSEAAVKQELLAQGINATDATEQQKVMARLSIIMRGTTAAQGDAIKTAGSWANQNKRIAGSITDISSAIGSVLIPLLSPYQTMVGDILSGADEWIGKNRLLVIGVAAAGGVLLAAGAGLLGLSAATLAGSMALSGLATAFGVLAPIIAALTSPIGLAVIGIGGAIAAFVAWKGSAGAALQAVSGGFGIVVDAASNFAGSIGSVLASAAGSVFEVIGRIPAAMGNALAVVGEVFGQVPGIISGAIGAIPGIIGGAITTAVGVLGNLPAAFGSMLSTIGGVISSLAGMLPGAFGSFGDAAGDVVGEVGKLFSMLGSMIGGALAPIRAIAGAAFFGIKAIAANVFAGIGAVMTPIVFVAQGVASSMLTGFEALLSGGGRIFGGFVSIATSTFSSLVETGSTIGGAMLGRLFGSAIEIVGSFVSSGVSMVSQFGATVLQFLGSPIETLKQVWGSLTNTISQLWSNVTALIGSPWERMLGVIDMVKGAAQIAFASMLGFGQGFLDGAMNLWKGIGDGALTAFGAIKTSFMDFAGGISQWFSGVVAEAKIAWDGISAAIAVNDLQSAWTIAWNTMKLVALQTFGPLQLAWNEFTTGLASMMDSAWVGIRQAFNAGSTFIADMVFGLIGHVQSLLDSIAAYDPTGLAQGLRDAIDVDTDGIRNALQQDSARVDQGLAQDKQARDDERGAALAEKQAELAQAMAEAQDEIRKARDAAVASAKAKQAEQSQALAEPVAPDADEFDIKKLFEAAIAGQKETERGSSGGSSPDIAGTFSSAAAIMLQQGGGTGSAEERTARATEAALENSKEIAKSTAAMERELAFLGTVG